MSADKNLTSRFLQFDQEPDSGKGARVKRVEEGATMNAVATAVLVGVALLIVAIWIEIRARRAA